MSKSILVIGASGKQGGAVARRLLDRGHKVRAFTRDPESPSAKALFEAGAEIAKGNLDDRASLDEAMRGVDAVFSMSTPFEAGEPAEVAQGKRVADAAHAADTYLVYTSVGSAHRNTGIPHFDSKAQVEKHIAIIGVRAAIIAPVYFMENSITFGRDQLSKGVYAMALPPTRKLAQIAVDDIGACAVSALEDPERYGGTRYDLGGDEVSGEQAVEILSRVTRREFSYFQVPVAAVREQSEDMALMYEWFDRVGYQVDHQSLRRAFPDVKFTSFDDWAKKQSWSSIFA